MNISPDQDAKKSFHATQGFLLNKRLATHEKSGYRAEFLISYSVNGVQYNRWVTGNGLDTSFWNNAGEEENILSRYHVGESYTCWYDPTAPQVAMLVPRHHWVSFAMLIRNKRVQS